MSTNKRSTSLSKPTLNTEAALAFASGSHAPSKAASKGEAGATHRKAAGTAPAAGKAVSGLVPDGDVRLTANIRKDLHKKLKWAAVERETTIGELIEELIETHL